MENSAHDFSHCKNHENPHSHLHYFSRIKPQKTENCEDIQYNWDRNTERKLVFLMKHSFYLQTLVMHMNPALVSSVLTLSLAGSSSKVAVL